MENVSNEWEASLKERIYRDKGTSPVVSSPCPISVTGFNFERIHGESYRFFVQDLSDDILYSPPYYHQVQNG
jgi:hypothetical protein